MRVTQIAAIYFIALIILLITPVINAQSLDKPVWSESDASGQPVIHLYFFWSEKCPHCLEARPDIVAMSNEYPWLILHSLELVHHQDNVQMFREMADIVGNDARSVPTFMFCGNSISGYESKDSTGRLLRAYLQACYQFAKEDGGDRIAEFVLDPSELSSVDIPWIGSVSSEDYSLPVLTIFIASMDAFNPCAFFVLLFLLSMLVHGHSRKRMMFIGGIFIFISGAIYYLFMAAWLNLFIYLGELRFITLIAGGVASFVALINIKDYFRFKKGFTLSMPDSAKPKLFDRVRLLLRMNSIVTVTFATALLAIVANSYELLCTAGFPMVYTRILTLKALPVEIYYLYLLLYNVIYILPLFVIVTLFTIKLGSRKLSEHEGMVLKLLSGLMMLMLGVILIISPALLNNIAVAATILFLAIISTWTIVKLTNVQKQDDLR